MPNAVANTAKKAEHQHTQNSLLRQNRNLPLPPEGSKELIQVVRYHLGEGEWHPGRLSAFR